MVMGLKAGMNLINQMKDIEAIVIDDNNTVYASDNIRFS
jgi:thiamine biosynthesis lipoprotein